PAAQTITQAEVYVDTPPWLGGQPIAMQPADGSFNSAKEQVVAVIDTSLNKGRHVLFVRARDSSGHWGPVAVAWLFLSAAPYYTLSGTVTDLISGDPLPATLILTGVMSVTGVITGEITATPFVSTTLADPATGNYSLTVASGRVDEVTATASEYRSKTQAINACDGCPGDQADFALLPVSITDRAYLPVVTRPASGEADLQ
ncbi:MAG: hypothetical protein M1546_00695, partial [Chloroflexi bacterium]|nr:hypothetical protein [Chloroflexota bacterium]